jgi:hypothetical protein
MILDCVRVLNPGAADRATRMAYAVQQLERGLSGGETARRMRDRFGCSRKEAWRLVKQARAVSLSPDEAAQDEKEGPGDT